MDFNYTVPIKGESDLDKDWLTDFDIEQAYEDGLEPPSSLTRSHSLLTSLSTRILRHFDANSPTLNRASFTKYSFSRMRFYHERAIALVHNFDNVHFLTVTFPGTTEEAVVASFNTALPAVKALLAEMRKWNQRKPVTFVACFEHSETGQLHLHMLLDIPRAHADKFTLQNISNTWADILAELSWHTGIDLCEAQDGCIWNSPNQIQVDIEPVRKPLSAACYITKLKDFKSSSSGPAKAPHVTPEGEIITTDLWAICSRNLKPLVVKEQLDLSFPVHSFEHGFLIIDSEIIPMVNQLVGKKLIWTDHINSFTRGLIGRRCWIKLSDLTKRKTASLKSRLKKVATGRRKLFPAGVKALVKCKVLLGLDGRLCLSLRCST